MRRRHSSALGLLVAVATLAGCSTKVNQCNELVAAIKRHTGPIGAEVEHLGKVESDPTVADGFGRVIAAARDDLAALRLEDTELAALAQRYLGLLDELDGWSRGLAQAVRHGDVEALGAAKAAAAGVVDKERVIVGEINAYCQG
ncbi:MAG: hypothetical protein K1X88_25900 [Nannocystaceae bacterium]|nr:hypothetical protein [Nannocystaceae bacterium]